MNRAIDHSKNLIMARVRNYPTSQKQCLCAYFVILISVGSRMSCLQDEWQAVPHLMPKYSKSKYQTTIDLRLINASMEAGQWPMPRIKAEIADFIKCNYFASLDFYSSYWQCPLKPSSYQACRIIPPQGMYVSTRVLHGLKGALSYIQATVNFSLDTLKHATNARIDDSIVYLIPEAKLLQHLYKLFTICKNYNIRLSAIESLP